MIDLWVKAFHIMAVIAWMAGMFYLPRLFVYHVDAPPGSAQSEAFKTMERRLLKLIVNPAMIAVWVTGPWLAYLDGFFSAPWLHAKLTLVILLTGYQGWLKMNLRKFANKANTRSARFWRLMNEVPALLRIAIVILVVVKPF